MTKRLLKNVGLYVIVFLPVHLVIGLLEGALQGHWPLSLDSVVFQAGAWAAFAAPALLILAVPAVVLLEITLGVADRLGRDVKRIFVVLEAPVAVLAVLLVLTQFGESSDIVPYLFSFLPIAFLAAGLCYGLVFRTRGVKRDISPPSMTK